MKSQMKCFSRVIPITNLIISIILLIVSFAIKNIPQNKTYHYTNNQIKFHSWHNVFENFIAAIFILTLISCIVSTFVCIAEGRKLQERIAKKISFVWIIGVVCCAVILLSGVVVLDVWADDDFSPSCYEFTDGKHTIVIEEKSFLLSGTGTVFQIEDNDKAMMLCEFSTDDGGRNNGHYDIKWYDNCVEITYNTFVTEDSKRTLKIDFIS